MPLITTKKVHWHSIVHELLWIISGDTNIRYLSKNNVRIWDEWASPEGDLGPVYGHQWRRYETGNPNKEPIDQLKNVIDLLKTDPDSRRIVVNAWNPVDLPYMALPPCHMMFQFKSYEVGETRKLSCHMYQRSADWFLGVPFNIASYALLTHMIARITGHTPGELIMSFGDTHIYDNLVTQTKEQLNRPPYDFPKVEFKGTQLTIDDYGCRDIELVGYKHHPLIKGKVAV